MNANSENRELDAWLYESPLLEVDNLDPSGLAVSEVERVEGCKLKFCPQ